jgi:hypothetical protein
MSSISSALDEWFRMLSAARTRVDGGEFPSTIILASVDTAALDIWWSLAIDC